MARTKRSTKQRLRQRVPALVEARRELEAIRKVTLSGTRDRLNRDGFVVMPLEPPSAARVKANVRETLSSDVIAENNRLYDFDNASELFYCTIINGNVH
jgi:hypothetical protein